MASNSPRNARLPDVSLKTLEGERYSDAVPDTLDLAERARLAVGGLAGTIDPQLRYLPFGIIHFCCRRPHLAHWACADVTCNPKYGEVFPMMRLMCGAREHVDLEEGNRRTLLQSVEDGLYWDRYTPDRPWRNAYAPAFYGKGKEEDFAVVGASGLLMRAISAWRALGGAPELDEIRRSLLAGMRRVAIWREDYCYYPEKGGWAEPCTYPRSGWLNTDEPETETQGGEGSVTAYHGNQIYAAAQWYAVSGDAEALDLAARLTRFCMKPKFWGGVADPGGERQGLPGHVAPRLPEPPYTAGMEQGRWYSHFHARAIALRGMLEYGRVAQDPAVLEFVRRAYEYTLTQGIARMGWINCYPGALDRCEGCALGDLVALGIRLSDAGLGDYWDDVDAVVRNHLAEQQLTRPDLLERIAARFDEPCYCEADAPPGKLCYENVIGRCIGVFGGTSLPTSIPSPWVMLCCTANGMRGLYYAWEGTVREGDGRADVNLLLNHASRLLDLHSYLPYEGKAVIRNKAARRVSVRIPSWAGRREVSTRVNGRATPLDWVGNRLVFGDLKPGDTITVTFPVKETTARYTVNAHSPREQAYTCTFCASTLVDISPRDEDPTSYPLYLRGHLRSSTAPMMQVERFVAERVVHDW